MGRRPVDGVRLVRLLLIAVGLVLLVACVNVALLAGAGLVSVSFYRQMKVDLGFRTDRALTVGWDHGIGMEVTWK